MPYESTEYHPAFEEYSETIYELSEDGVDVIQARIAERLNVSRPAVSEMVHRMADNGLVEVDERSRISLTDAGRTIATTVVRRHRVAERFLTDILGLPWAAAHHEAGRWEHVISPEVEAALIRILDDPTTCPHGNPIPGSGYLQPESWQLLSESDIDVPFTVRRIPEELEFEPGQLEFLEAAGVMPGRVGSIVSAAPDGTLLISIDGEVAGIGTFAASRIFVSTGE
jgi:DtxR family Mn-dependent transcriptional regulator